MKRWRSPRGFLHPLVVLVIAVPITILAAGVSIRQPGAPLQRAVHLLDANALTLRMAREAGFDTVVLLFNWRQIEPTEGEYHWQYPDEVVQGAAYYGLNLVVRLDQHPGWTADAPLTVNAPPRNPADYAQFAQTVAARYRGLVLGYIIWNEPNLASDWGGQAPDPAGYVALLKAAYQAVKAADPHALVISAGLAPTNDRSLTAVDDRAYLEAMYEAGAAPYFDVLGAHPYGFAYPPDDARDAHEGLNMARLSDLHDIMLRHGDGGKLVWATEMGWTVEGAGPAAWQTVSEQQQADYLAHAFAQAGQRWPWLDMLTVWNLSDQPDSPWAGYSLLDAAGQPRPAYAALQRSFRPTLPALLSERISRLNQWLRVRVDGQKYQVLASDTIVHLGDGDYSAQWAPLHGARSPSTQWDGTVYVREAAAGPWYLTVRLMQSNTAGNFIWVNGQRLDPAFPVEDFSSSWVAYTWIVPAGVLVSGPNQIRVTVAGALPLLQDWPMNWDDLQFRDMVLYHGVE